MPAGRPKYVPSDNDRALVRNMAAAGVASNLIQRCLPGAPKDDEAFRNAFRDEIETSGSIVSAKAISKLVVAIDKGEAWAICFWLKCKAGFQETSAHRMVNKNGDDAEPTTIIVEYEDRAAKAPPTTPSTIDSPR